MEKIGTYFDAPVKMQTIVIKRDGFKRVYPNSYDKKGLAKFIDELVVPYRKFPIFEKLKVISKRVCVPKKSNHIMCELAEIKIIVKYKEWPNL